MTDECKSPWNSLEIAKLLVTPLVVALLGFFFQSQLADQASATQKILAEQARSWQQSQRLANRRLQLYEEISDDLNKIYCFVEDVGSWKEDNPDTIIVYKRNVERVMHSHRAIWSTDAFAAYLKYMDSAFLEYAGGAGGDAKIATTVVEKRKGIAGWSAKWESKVTGKRADEHQSDYDKLQNLLSRDMSLILGEPHLSP